MPKWIIDTSVVVKWFVREADSDLANQLVFGTHDLSAPDLVLIEFANALRKCVRAGVMLEARAETSLAALPRFFAEILPAGALLQDALAIACSLQHPIYDCIYLAASQSTETPLITSDATFVAKLAGTPYAANVVLLANWKP
jgi:predicted nucleic acid-binding protein